MSKPAGVIIDEARHKAQELQSQRRHSQQFLENARSRPSSLVLRGAFGGGVSEPARTPCRSRVAAPEQDDVLTMVLERLLSLEARAPPDHPYLLYYTAHCTLSCAMCITRPMAVGCLSQGRIDRRFSAIETKLGIETLSVDANAPPTVQAELSSEERSSPPKPSPPGKAKGGVVFAVPPDG